MNKFYFFKITLNYFDDEQKTFFITPDQSETDEQGVPFSENVLRNTEEFKEFVKATKADIIDVDYTEFAVEYDSKRSDILNKPITDDSFAELEKSGRLEIVDENQFLILLKKTAGGKKSRGGYLFPVIAVAAFVIGILAGASFKGKGSSSDNSDTSSEVYEVSENTSESESGAESISDEQSAVESVPNTAESSTQSTASSTASTTAPEPSEAVSSVASSVTVSQSRPAESSEETHEAVTASSDVSD